MLKRPHSASRNSTDQQQTPGVKSIHVCMNTNKKRDVRVVPELEEVSSYVGQTTGGVLLHYL